MGNKILLVIEDVFLGRATARCLNARQRGDYTVVGVNGRHAALAVLDKDPTGFCLVVTEPIEPSTFGAFVESVRKRSAPDLKVVLYSDCRCTDHLGCLTNATVAKTDENCTNILVQTVQQLLAA